MTIVKGSTRWVFVAKKFVYKIPSLYSFKHFLLGLLANMQEVEFSKCKDFKETLCPVKFYFSLGLLVVMPKARILEPNEVSKDFLKEFCLNANLRDLVEFKHNSFGYLDKKLVAVDYG